MTSQSINLSGVAELPEGDTKLDLRFQEIAELTKLLIDAENEGNVLSAADEQRLKARFEELAAFTRMVMEQENRALRLEAQLADVIRLHRVRRSFWINVKDTLKLFVGINLRYVGLLQERRKTLMTGMFDAEWYRNAYPDVALSGLDPVYHYLMFGVKEGRNPNPSFSTAHYLSQSGVAGTRVVNPLTHYVAQLTVITEERLY